MKPKDLVALGIPPDCVADAIGAVKTAFQQRVAPSKNKLSDVLREIASDPGAYIQANAGPGPFLDLAEAIRKSNERQASETTAWATNPVGAPGTYSQWGSDIEEGALAQMRDAVELPVAVAGALMPDAHQGYGLPVGGVLATYDSVVPYAVGVDIACRMKLSILDIPADRLDDPFSPQVDPFIRALTGGSVFGMGRCHQTKQNHDVMDRDWNVTSVTRHLRDRAWSQLGSSGSGNHFVEFGLLTLERPELGLEPGVYVALMSHSGSRGTGAAVCSHYVDIAKSRLPAAYKRFENLAWLPLSSEAGHEYWLAMNLMGEYAAANHAIIHKLVAKLIGGNILAGVENHHNFTWREVHGGRELLVHRKGATPAGEGVLGVIPGSMASPAYVVRGKGKPQSLMSASHGAGRRMSRTRAIREFNWADWKSIIRQRKVRLLSGGLDEVPGAYKDINAVMAAQADLVDVIARFDPRIVRMSDDGRSED